MLNTILVDIINNTLELDTPVHDLSEVAIHTDVEVVSEEDLDVFFLDSIFN